MSEALKPAKVQVAKFLPSQPHDSFSHLMKGWWHSHNRPSLGFPRSNSHTSNERHGFFGRGRGQWAVRGSFRTFYRTVLFHLWIWALLLIPSPVHKDKNNSIHLLNTYCAQGTVLSPLQASSHLTISTTRWCRNYYSPHETAKKQILRDFKWLFQFTQVLWVL